MSIRTWTVMGLMSFAALAAAADGVEKLQETSGTTLCRVETLNDVPVLSIDGKRIPPLIFFFNNHCATGPRRPFWEPQAKMAGEAGVHIYSFCLTMPPLGSGTEPSLDELKAALDPFIKADPKALFIPRIYVGASGAWLAANPQDQMVYADGTRGYEAIASEKWKSGTHQQLEKYIRFIEASAYAPRFIGYHISAQNTGEWFPQAYTEKGPDIGVANAIGFRAWLKAKYATDEALRKAWGNADTSLASAAVPVPVAGRFPVHGAPSTVEFESFYRLPEERNWVDYSQYTSELTATRIIEFARTIKEATQGRKLAVFFYGYMMVLPGSIGGHHDLLRVLNCPDIDVLASPVAYDERYRGEATGFMAPVDSVAAHGKLWVIENDMRTHLWSPKHLPPEIANTPDMQSDLLSIPRSRDAAETVQILKRDYAAMLAHRCGTWWMDLCAVGAFNDPAIWRMIDQQRPRDEALCAKPFPFQPEAAMIVDEGSRNFEKSDVDLCSQAIINLRYQMGLTGASFGLYLLDDFINGRVPPCKAYVFANAFSMDGPRCEAIRGRLEREGATAVWLYAPGYLAPSGASLEQSQRLTGMKLMRKDGLLGSRWVGGDGDVAIWGVQTRKLDQPRIFAVSPRLAVKDDTAQVFGRYLADCEASAAFKRQGRATHVFLGDISVTAPLLRRVLKQAKVHLWTDANLVVYTDGTFLSVHAADAGVYPIYLPAGVTLESADGRVQGQAEGILYAQFDRAETRTFKICRTDGK